MQIFRSPVEVLPAIKLNDDCGFQPNKITNVDADRMLPSKLEVVQLAATQTTPEPSFGIGEITAQLAREMKSSREMIMHIRSKYDAYSTFACVSHDPSALRAPPHA